jgi:hypothetical protein
MSHWQLISSSFSGHLPCLLAQLEMTAGLDNSKINVTFWAKIISETAAKSGRVPKMSDQFFLIRALMSSLTTSFRMLESQ